MGMLPKALIRRTITATPITVMRHIPVTILIIMDTTTGGRGFLTDFIGPGTRITMRTTVFTRTIGGMATTRTMAAILVAALTPARS